LVLGLAGVSGACTLALEGLWARLLRVIFGHDVHAFSSMLVAVLVGLAFGAGLYRVLSPRIRSSRVLIPLLFALLGLSVLLSLGLVGRIYLSRGLDLFGLSEALGIIRSHEQALALQLIFAATLILATATLSGAILPALCAGYQPRAEATAAGAL